MIENILRAWAAAADPDFGGSLDTVELAPNLGAAPASGVPYCYRNRKTWQVRIPGQPSRCFKDIDAARAYVEGVLS